jgi:ribonuclease P protein component
MLPKNNRLKKTAEIKKVFKDGRFFKESFLILKTTKNKLDKSRFGFIVSQKISRKAVIRNKIKRRLRAIVMKNLKTVKTGTDNLVITLPGIEKKDFSNTEQTVNNLFKKAKLFSND